MNLGQPITHKGFVLVISFFRAGLDLWRANQTNGRPGSSGHVHPCYVMG
jgi:hypothetical protein